MANSIGIIGFGRFGKVLYNILSKGFIIKVYDSVTDPITNSIIENFNQEFSQAEFVDWDTLLQEKVIFVAVPINRFEEVIRKMSPSLTDRHTVIDVCSVKVHPSRIMNQYLPPKTGIIATHPLFGPDSYLDPREKRKIMMHCLRSYPEDKDSLQYSSWKNFFSKQGFEIIEMTPEEHDRMAAETQGITHYLGRFLKEYGIKKTPIDTQGFTDLLDLVDQTCNDTWELYIDLQKFNPYTQEMIKKINQSIKQLNQKSVHFQTSTR